MSSLWHWMSGWFWSPRLPNYAKLEGTSVIVPEHPDARDDGDESLDVWGFIDTRFQATNDGQVEVTGSRYPLSGKKLPNLLPWFSNLMEVAIPSKSELPSQYPPSIPEAVINESFLAQLEVKFGKGKIERSPTQRLRHGHGHSQGEMYAIKHSQLARIPDIIFYPEAEEDVTRLVKLAARHNVCLIPYGGGTNVSEALECSHEEKRMIVSVDMRRMNKILWIDPHNRIASIEAGAVGRHIMEDLAKKGFTMGHEPDSVEFSTLGGWIATNASGMKKNKYGNIEDIVLGVNFVTAGGLLTRSNILPRESIGVDVQKLAFGSEGSLGIVTSAVVKIISLPEVQNYGSILFRSFEDGVAFMYELTQAGSQPASIRLVDNTQFQFSMALKPAPTPYAAFMSRLQKAYVTSIMGFDPQKMVACTLVFEGSAIDVKRQEATVYALARKHRGMKAGAENGERGYLLTYNIAYIRDFGIQHYVLAESFETSVPWSGVLELCQRTKARVHREHAERKLPGKPFVTCRVTQVYQTGAAVYFYLAYFFKGVDNPSGVYAELEKAARDEILLCGGALSHHHGVGKLRHGFLDRIMSEGALDWRRAIKKSTDPGNIFGVREM